MNFLSQLKEFIQNLAKDQRIPSRDKKLILILAFLLVSPFDFIPDWVPFFGLLDDFLILAILFNYFFNVLDSRLMLSHYPWSMKSYSRLRAISNLLGILVPRIVKKNIWKYKADPY